MSDVPRTLYTWNGGWALAHQVVGSGPDLIYLPGFDASIDLAWRHPSYGQFLRRLASFSRLSLMDRRGWGGSDRFSPGTHAEIGDLVDDLLLVAAATNATRPAIFATSESAFIALEAVATHPRAFSRLILFHASPSWTQNDDLPWETTADEVAAEIRSIERAVSWDDWMQPYIREAQPSLHGDSVALSWLGAASRGLIAPGALVAELRWIFDLDLRDRLDQIPIPTLVLYRPEHTCPAQESARYLAERIPDARLVAVPGPDAFAWVGDWEAMTDEIQEFLTGIARARGRAAERGHRPVH